MHVDRILALPFLERGFGDGLKVLFDANGGAGATVIPILLKQSGAEYICTGGNLDGIFIHPPVPTPENLSSIGDMVKAETTNIGLASDPDADRLALIDEKGTPLSEELTLAIAIDFMLEMVKTPVVVNLSTSSLIEHIAQKHDVPVYRTPVGEINVSSKMFEVGSAIGGEGNGGVILPEVHPGRDAATGAALVMAAMNRWNRSLSEIVAAYPERHIVKTQIDLPGGSFSIDREALLSKLNPTSINEEDGLWLGFPDGFLHIRSSNTEPILRIIAESSTEEDAMRKIEMSREFLNL